MPTLKRGATRKFELDENLILQYKIIQYETLLPAATAGSAHPGLGFGACPAVWNEEVGRSA